MKYREDVTEGLQRAPEAFLGMLAGRTSARRWSRSGTEAAVRPLPNTPRCSRKLTPASSAASTRVLLCWFIDEV
jgi:hypothetical protein